MKSILKLSIMIAVLLSAIAVANAAAPANNVPAWNGYAGVKITITGAQNTYVVYAHNFSYSLVSPRDPATGQATGRHKHSPIKITKLINEVSPRLFQALVNNETLGSVVIQFIGTDKSNGSTITLTNAHVVRYEPHSQSIIAGKPFVEGVAPWFNQLEDIEMVFETISISSANGSSTAEDDWAAGVQ